MSDFIDTLLEAAVTPIGSAIGELLLYASALLIIYLIAHRKTPGFIRSLGLFLPEPRALPPALAAGMLLPLLFVVFLYFRLGMNPAFWKVFVLKIPPLQVLTALVLLALAEELFYRGYLAKRLIGRFGFPAGNAAQAAVFGLIHPVSHWLAGRMSNPADLIGSFVFTAIAGWVFCWLMERRSNGSIVPGWAAHTLSNSIVFFLVNPNNLGWKL